MPKRFFPFFMPVLLLLQLAGCELFYGKTVEGRLDMEVALRGFSLERGLDIENRNFIIWQGVAYELVFLEETRFVDFPDDRKGIAVPVPAEPGTVRLEPGAKYRIKGRTELTGDRHNNLPVEMIRLRSIEYLGPGTETGGLRIRF
ncbi:MAG: hypothetical protein FJZ79_07510 [Chlorobi bacterium]|nr:hypothetical protein [Chlorobiota bacterium]